MDKKAKEEKSTDTIIMNDVSEIFNILKNSTMETKVYYNDSIVHIIDYFMNTLKHKPELIGDQLKPTACFVKLSNDLNEDETIIKKSEHILDDDEIIQIQSNFRVTFHSLTRNVTSCETTRDTLDELTKEEMTKYNDIVERINKKFFLQKYMSDYSDDMKTVIDEIPNSLYMSCSKNQPKNLYGIDCNKSYAYQTFNIKEFGKFTLFDEFEDYDGHEIEDLSVYRVKFNKSKQTIYDRIASFRKEEYNTFDTYGLFLKKYKLYISSFTILKFIRPYDKVQNPICDDIKNIYSEDLPKSLIKGIPNIFLGKCYKRNNSNKKTYLSTNEEELIYLQRQKKINKEIEGKKPSDFSQIIPLKDNLFYMMESNSKRMDNGFCVLPTMVYCFQRYRLMKMYRKLRNQGIKIYSIKVDSLKIDYLNLSLQQKEFVDNLCNPNQWGGVKLETPKVMINNQSVQRNLQPVDLDDFAIPDDEIEIFDVDFDE